MGKFIPTVCFDFDGVIHSYVSGWKGKGVIPDEPVEGIERELRKLKESGWDIVIYTTRADEPIGIQAVWEYLRKYNMAQYIKEVTAQKPLCVVTVDDRVIQFNGNTRELAERVVGFRSYIDKKKGR